MQEEKQFEVAQAEVPLLMWWEIISHGVVERCVYLFFESFVSGKFARGRVDSGALRYGNGGCDLVDLLAEFLDQGKLLVELSVEDDFGDEGTVGAGHVFEDISDDACSKIGEGGFEGFNPSFHGGLAEVCLHLELISFKSDCVLDGLLCETAAEVGE